MIEAQQLVRRYGEFTAVRGISFAVEEGEIVGILGPNGAGKTTTIRMITGFLPPTSGRVTVAGKDLFEVPREARRDIGYLPENVAPYPEMRVEEYLRYRARLEGLSRGSERRAIGEAVERCLLTEVRRQIIGTLSKGFRQRVGLATAILHKPRVLVLDEPTVGLDPKQIIAIRELIRELGRERTLLLSTHILPEVELLCDRLMIIDHGRMVAVGTPQGLRRSGLGEREVRVEVDGADPAEALALLASLEGVHQVEVGEGDNDKAYRLHLDDDSDPRAIIFDAAVERGWRLLTLSLEEPTLEETFVRLTTRDPLAKDDEVHEHHRAVPPPPHRPNPGSARRETPSAGPSGESAP
jgi:ABC-2 type transport system ATP-binding protein